MVNFKVKMYVNRKFLIKSWIERGKARNDIIMFNNMSQSSRKHQIMNPYTPQRKKHNSNESPTHALILHNHVPSTLGTDPFLLKRSNVCIGNKILDVARDMEEFGE